MELRTFFVSSAGSEVAAVLAVMLFVGLITAPLAFFADSQVTASGTAPVNPCAREIAAKSSVTVADQVQISDASGANNSLDVYTGRDGGTVERVSLPLSVQNGLLTPDECFGTIVSDLVRSDGQVIPASQITSWAQSGNAGLRIFVYIEISPRYGSVTPSGGYTGTVSMDDDRAVGGNVPVTIHVEYPRLWRATMVCIAAAWFGFFWAWLIHLTRADVPTSGRFWLYVILQLAVLTIVSFPVLNAQILTNPDWTGDLSQYIALASLAGGGALATTPTLRALVDRAAIFMPGATGPSTAAADQTASATPPDAQAGTQPDAAGDSAAPAEASGASAANGSSDANGEGQTTAAGADGGITVGPGTPPDPDDGTPAVPITAPGPDDGTPAVPAASPGPDDGTLATPATPAVPNGSATPAVPV
jgi:hypothetical protein